MPSISMFLGIIIRMYFSDQDKHKSPHMHAFYSGYEAVFNLDGEILAGDFPAKQEALVKAWALIHEEELNANWELCKAGEPAFRIDPLR